MKELIPLIEPGQWVILVTTVIGFLTTALTFWVQLHREKRNRQWDLEDRRETAKQLAAKTEAAQQEIEKKIDENTRVTAKVKEEVVQKIEENTQINVDALKEANAVNRKLEAIGSLIDAVRTKEQIDHVALVVEETKKLVAERTGVATEELDHGLPPGKKKSDSSKR